MIEGNDCMEEWIMTEYWMTVKEGIMVNEGRNEQWMTVKEGNMMNEGKNENEWILTSCWLTVKEGDMNDEWRKKCEGRKNDERRNCKWRNGYLPRTVMTVGMNDECRNEWKWMMLKERMITYLERNECKGRIMKEWTRKEWKERKNNWRKE